MNTPTPRTDAAWSASFDGAQMSAGQTARALRECSQQLERELTALTAEREKAERYRLVTLKLDAELASERARLDWLLLDNLTRFNDSFSHRTAIDAAMKGGEK